MDRVAIFVDAGYLFAQGSVALTGSQKPRASTVLDAPAVIDALRKMAFTKAPHATMLRIYWYDGAVGGSRPTADQALLANLDDVKLRLGFINNSGQQKGVDSLIVTDLIELARQKSICDAVLLSGDEDVRVGVQIAQNYGVRVHLLGIKPSRGSQSHQLLQEADTTYEWNAEIIATFLSMRVAKAEKPMAEHAEAILVPAAKPEGEQKNGKETSVLDAAVSDFVQTLEDSDLDGIVAYWETDRGVPFDFDRKLLPCGRQALGRDLERDEIRLARSHFQSLVKIRLAAR
ncbi:MAG: NYN domain-containing protein [Mesorhizobium sp.]|nr:MAG: NYN domain-containing protein [Mesorhizobium sp.]